jgi:hypothetical protein
MKEEQRDIRRDERELGDLARHHDDHEDED